jgi:hypothetical protein
MDPVTVVADHKVPEADDDAKRVLFDETRDCVAGGWTSRATRCSPS